MRLITAIRKLPSLSFMAKKAAEKLLSIIRPRQHIIIANIKNVLRRYLDIDPTLNSLKGDDPDGLRAHFGLSRSFAAKAVEDIKYAWVSSITSTLVTSTRRGEVGFTIKSSKRNYNTFLESPYASYISPRSGEQIDWLKWLLLEANSIRIFSWRFHPKTGTGRSGLGIMVNSKKRPVFWQIPAPHNQDEPHNFINRIIQNEAFQAEIKLAVQAGLQGRSV